MKKLQILFGILFFVLVPMIAQSHHEQAPEDIFKLQQITPSVYILYGRGGNIGFYIGPDSVLVVDSQYRDIAPGIEEKIKSVTDKPIKFLLNTHHHGDHTGGNTHFIKFSVVVAHSNVRKRMLAAPQTILKEYPAEMEKARKEGKEEDVKWYQEQIDWAKKVKIEEIAAPYVTYESEMQIHLGDETIQIWHTPPAHTDGDTVVYFKKANVLHMGDLLFHKVIPFIDTHSGGSAAGYIRALDSVAKKMPKDVKVIPGHGELTDLSGVAELRKYVSTLIERAKAAKKAGKSKEQFVKETKIPEYEQWKAYDSRFSQNVEAAYDTSE